MDQAHDINLLTVLNTLIVSLAAILLALTGFIALLWKIFLEIQKNTLQQSQNKADFNIRSDALNEKIDQQGVDLKKNNIVSARAAENSEAVKNTVKDLPHIVIEELKNGVGKHIAAKITEGIIDPVKKVVQDGKDEVISVAAKEIVAFNKSAERAKIFAEGVVEGRRQRDAEIALLKAAKTDHAIPNIETLQKERDKK